VLLVSRAKPELCGRLQAIVNAVRFLDLAINLATALGHACGRNEVCAAPTILLKNWLARYAAAFSPMRGMIADWELRAIVPRLPGAEAATCGRYNPRGMLRERLQYLFWRGKRHSAKFQRRRSSEL
jgi:hypothetical protein